MRACAYRYEAAEQIGHERSRHGAPCRNHASYEYPQGWFCFLHRPDIKAIVKAQKAVVWLLWGSDAPV